MSRFATGYIRLAQRIVDGSGCVEFVERWLAEDRAAKHAGGAPRVIGVRAALIILVMHQLESKGMKYVRIAETLSHRLTGEQCDVIGIPFERRVNWYHRIYSAVRLILGAMDPYPFPTYERTRKGGTPVSERLTRRRVLTAEEYRDLQAWRGPEERRAKQKRIDESPEIRPTSGLGTGSSPRNHHGRRSTSASEHRAAGFRTEILGRTPDTQ